MNVCLFLLVIACCIHLSANPAKSVYLGIWSKPVGPQLGRGARRMKNVRVRVVDVAVTCMTLEKDVVIVSHPSPRGQWLVQSCKSRTTQKFSICTVPHCGTFLNRILTAALTSFVNRDPAHIRGVLGGSNYLHSHTGFLVFLTIADKESIMWNRSRNLGRHHSSRLDNWISCNPSLSDQNQSQNHKDFISQWTWLSRNCYWNRSILIHGNIFLKCTIIVFKGFAVQHLSLVSSVENCSCYWPCHPLGGSLGMTSSVTLPQLFYTFHSLGSSMLTSQLWHIDSRALHIMHRGKSIIGAGNPME